MRSSNKTLAFSKITSIFVADYRSTLLGIMLTIILAVGTALHLQELDKRFHYTDLPLNKDITFDHRLLLENVGVASTNDGVKIKLTWRSLVAQTLNRTVAINMLDASNAMLSQYEHQDSSALHLQPGQSWSETIFAPPDEDNDKKCLKLGLRLGLRPIDSHHKAYIQWLSPKNCQSDWWNTRLIVPLKNSFLPSAQLLAQ